MASTNFDHALGMWIEKPAVPVLPRLAFLRWMAEEGRLEHPVAGVSSGPLAKALACPEYSGKA
jgi:hypothetical protein